MTLSGAPVAQTIASALEHDIDAEAFFSPSEYDARVAAATRPRSSEGWRPALATEP
jgi:hypothetical protein